MQNGFECYNLSGGYRLYKSIFPKKSGKKPEVEMNTETMQPKAMYTYIDACGLQCPGPIMKLSQALLNAADGELIQIASTDPAFAADVESWCRRTGNSFEGLTSEKGVIKAAVRKGGTIHASSSSTQDKSNKNLIVFSGDLDKAIASFIMANGAASMGRKVSMFFTFWGLNILRKPEKVKVKKDIISRMFGTMMPRGSKRLSLSKMNMGGMGAKMMRSVMKNKNIYSLEDLIKFSLQNGVELVACTMSMDVMGIKMEELIDGVKPGGVAAMLANAEESDMSLFI